MLKVPITSLCTDVYLESTPYIVFPINSMDTPDCVCPILLQHNHTYYDTSRCACLQKTIFNESLQIQKIKGGYELCIFPLNTSMNGTVIHIFESLRRCTDMYAVDIPRDWRRYRASFKILLGNLAISYK